MAVRKSASSRSRPTARDVHRFIEDLAARAALASAAHRHVSIFHYTFRTLVRGRAPGAIPKLIERRISRESRENGSATAALDSARAMRIASLGSCAVEQDREIISS